MDQKELVVKARKALPDPKEIMNLRYKALVWHNLMPFQVNFIKLKVPSGKVLWIYKPPVKLYWQ